MVGNLGNILIVDDEPVVYDLLNQELGERGYSCAWAPDGKIALTKLAAKEFDAVLLDIHLPGISGMDVLRSIGEIYPGIAVIMVTVVGNIDMAVQAVKLGASDYIVKPFEMERLVSSIHAALQGNHKPVLKERFQ